MLWLLGPKVICAASGELASINNPRVATEANRRDFMIVRLIAAITSSRDDCRLLGNTCANEQKQYLSGFYKVLCKDCRQRVRGEIGISNLSARPINERIGVSNFFLNVA